MGNAKILVVEDEGVLAKGIEKKMVALEYSVTGIAFSGQEAIRMAEENRPDLVLMDIKLDGEMDGVETAGHIREKFDIPVVYLTAYSDKETIRRAKITEPYGYILKPVNERELHCNIEMALYKHKVEAELLKKEKMEVVEKFSIGIAHDFNNLLQGISGFVEMAMIKCGIPSSKNTCPSYLEKASQNIKKAAELVKMYQAIFMGELLNKDPLTIAGIITRIEKAVNQVQEEKNIKIPYRLDTDKSHFPLSGNADRLEEAFVHLVRNAVEAMVGKEEHGQIMLSVNDVSVESENEWLLKEGPYVKVSIQDQGKGIPEENIKKVFIPYFTTKNEPSRKGQGLGMTLCYYIIKQHGGHIEIKSEKGKGTTVDVFLPAAGHP
jgi:signal transduction histidine kinase